LKETDKKVYKCAICGYQTLLKRNLDCHKKTHLAPEERELFACIHCDKKYTSKQGVRRHIEDNHIDSRSKTARKNIHKCSICGYQTHDIANFQRHQKIHLAPDERQMFACAYCDKKYTEKRKLKYHLDAKHIDSRSKDAQKNLQKCSICGYQTPYMSHLRRHQEIHLAPDERQLFACAYCDKKYTEKRKLKYHLDAKHIDSRSKDAQTNLHKCSICGYQTPFISCLQRHQEIHLAPDERQLFACAHCDKKYTEKRKLKFHLDAKHIDSRSKDARKNIHTCSICGYQTRNITNFQRHQEIHLAPDERQLFACAHCDKKYTTKQRLKDHLDANHIDCRSKDARKNIHTCSICGYQTPYISCLQRHQKIHLAPDERQMFACAHCDKKYTAKQKLKDHLDANHIDCRSKDAQKNLQKCSICNYQTPYMSHLKRHQKIHLAPDERQLFACAHCDKKYTENRKLKFHLDAKHIDSRSKDAQKNRHKCSICGYQTPSISHFQRHQKIHLAPDERQLFACAHCDKKYTEKQRLKDHLDAKHIDSRSKDAQKNLHKCSICGYQTPFISCLQRHQKIHLAPDERQLFACAHCDKKYTEKQRLKDHLDANHIDCRSKDAQKNLHKCSICGYQTPFISCLQRHQKIHLAPDERQLFACAHCDKKYTEKQRLKDHLGANHIDSRSKDAQKNLHKCSICSYQTPNIWHLQRHQKIHLAPDERQLFACAHCDKKYTEKQRLKDHLDANHIDCRSKDAQKNLHKCSICSYQTAYLSHLQRHQKIHLAPDERQLFACAHCDKKYTEKQRLKDHLDVNHSDSRSKEAELKVHKCAICGFQTLDKRNFYRHGKIHMAPEDRQLFACAHCDKKYTSKQNLRHHIEESKNPQENIHKCSICGYQTRHVAHFRKHQNIHLILEERQKFACAHCGKKFTQKILLRYHIERNICIDSRSKDARKNIHTCSICGYQTRNITNFQRHQEIHLAPDERQLFACAHCDKKYTTKQRLKDHLDANHIDCRSKDAQKNLHKCSTCSYQTREKTHLQRHQEIHLAPDERQLFACAHCDKKYTEKRILKFHLDAKHIDSRSKKSQKKVYKCAICDFRTLHRRSLQNHKKTHLAPEARQLFECTHCDKKYTSRQGLRHHIEDNHIDSRIEQFNETGIQAVRRNQSKDAQKNLHKCSICGYQTPYISHLRRHQEIHLAPDERQLFACAHCDKKYTEKRKLKFHLYAKHIDSRSKKSQKKVYKCAICDFRTLHRRSLQNHKKTHLAPEARQLFECTHCDKKYTSRQGLRHHIEDNHIDSRSKAARKNIHKCSTCSYQTPYSTHLQRHQEIHLAPDERQLFACAHCDKKYTEKQRLKVHFDVDHMGSRSKTARKNIHKCSICGYQTHDKTHLQRHQEIHLAPDERQLFACAYCDKKYTEKRRLKGHLDVNHIDSRAKEGELKVYKCAICGYQTLDKPNFYRHEKIHMAPEDRQLFACAHCDKRYTIKQTLRRHLEKKHIDARSKEAEEEVFHCTKCDIHTPYKSNFCSQKKIHLPLKDRQLFACTHCNKKYTTKYFLRRHLEHNHIDSRNADCTFSTDEVILDALKIEIDDLASPLDDSKNSECLSVTNEIKSEDFIKTEPEDVAPIMKTEAHDDFKNSENESATRNVKLEDFIKMEPDDDV
ncbi:zinc finger protein Xfin-like, partial [Sitophilus oryzae]|uniref:Zinc finger protein Xfin-like n=1 Tax=Sitophilus oryzae TaxID=7048 RepID=A0A6J2YAM2_SITOR